MKKLLLVIFLFTIFHISTFAPSLPTAFIVPVYNPIAYVDKLKVEYAPLIKAMGIIESGCDTSVVNIKENAHGYFQIRECRIKHYNKLTGKNYTLKDMHNFDLAQEVFLYFVNHDNRGNIIKDKPFDRVAKNWNGSGPMTETYWQRVQATLQLIKGQKV